MKNCYVIFFALTILVLSSASTLNAQKRKSAAKTQTQRKSNDLTNKQRSLAREALIALRELDAATQHGTTYDNYLQLVTRHQATIEQTLDDLTPHSITNHIGGALQLHLDALYLWDRYRTYQAQEIAVLRRAALELSEERAIAEGRSIQPGAYLEEIEYFEYDPNDEDIKILKERWNLPTTTKHSKSVVTKRAIFSLWSISGIYIKNINELLSPKQSSVN